MSFRSADASALTFRQAFAGRWARLVMRHYGSPAEAAEDLGVSERQVRNWFNEMSAPSGAVVARFLCARPQAVAELRGEGE